LKNDVTYVIGYGVRLAQPQPESGFTYTFPYGVAPHSESSKHALGHTVDIQEFDGAS